MPTTAITDRKEHRKKKNKERLDKWKEENMLGFCLWQIKDPEGKFTLEAHQTRGGVQILQIFTDTPNDFIVFKS